MRVIVVGGGVVAPALKDGTLVIAEAALWSAARGRPPTETTDVLIVLFSLAMGIQTAAVMSLSAQRIGLPNRGFRIR